MLEITVNSCRAQVASRPKIVLNSVSEKYQPSGVTSIDKVEHLGAKILLKLFTTKTANKNITSYGQCR